MTKQREDALRELTDEFAAAAVDVIFQSEIDVTVFQRVASHHPELLHWDDMVAVRRRVVDLINQTVDDPKAGS